MSQKYCKLDIVSEKEQNAYEVLIRWRHEEAVFKIAELEKKLVKVRNVIMKVDQEFLEIRDSYRGLIKHLNEIKDGDK